MYIKFSFNGHEGIALGFRMDWPHKVYDKPGDMRKIWWFSARINLLIWNVLISA